MTNHTPNHNCLENLDALCQCRVCGLSHHFVVNDDNGSGTGRVNEVCLRCGQTSAFYSESGHELYNEMTGTGKDFAGEKTSKEAVVQKLLPVHNCRKYMRQNATICLLCRKWL